MPDPQAIPKELRRKKAFEMHKNIRIQELAKLWNVPTQDIFTQVHWGYDGGDGGAEIPDQAIYSVSRNNKVVYQKIDRAPVRGWPAGVYSPKANPATVPISVEQATQGSRPAIISTATGTTPQPIPPKAPGRKAQYGDILPINTRRPISTALENAPTAPFSVRDHRIAAFFNDPAQRRMIPAMATLDGPTQGTTQYLLDPESGKMIEDGYQAPVPIVPVAKRAGVGFQMNINTAPAITGIAGAINSLYDRSAGLKEFTRLKRKQLQDGGYNPFQYGTGSQAIYKNGGKLGSKPAIERISENPASSPMLAFNGPSHDQGGIPIAYNGTQVEVEGGEAGYVDRQGDLNIFGDLPVPGMGKKFKHLAKQIADQERRAITRLRKAGQSSAQADNTDPFEVLGINTASLKSMAAHQQLEGLSMLKERLSALQEVELSRRGLQHAELAQDGKKVRQLKPSMAERHNNPGNIKYAPWLKKYGAVKGERASDGGNFARFPDKEAGLKAMRGLLRSPSYKSRTVEDAISRWTNSEGYKLDLGDLKGKKVGNLDDNGLRLLMDKITQGEDSKLYDLDFLFTNPPKEPKIDASIKPPALGVRPPSDSTAPGIPGTYKNPVPDTPRPATPNVTIPDLPDIEVPPTHEKPPVRNPMRFSQIAPELLALMDRPEFIPGQRYEPSLHQPYQVSFQDRLSENQATFNRLALQSGNNPAALSVLAGQKYMADAGILSDEFRTNQGITNEITNKNIAILNDAQLKNLQLADTQFVRQQQAKSNTERNIYDAVSSIAAKYAQNRLETRSYNAISGLYPQYEFDQNGSAQYIPNEGMQFGIPSTGAAGDFYQRSRLEYDGSGKLRKLIYNNPSGAERTKLDYQIWNNRLKQIYTPMGTARKNLKSIS